MTRSVCFDVLTLPQSVNDWRRGSGHWSIRAKEQERVASWVRLAVTQHKAQPVAGPVHVALTFYLDARRRRDPDNMAKHVLDALKTCGLIEDDGPPIMVSLTLACRYDKQRPRTEVYIAQADAPAWEAPTRQTRCHPRSKPTEGRTDEGA